MMAMWLAMATAAGTLAVVPPDDGATAAAAGFDLATYAVGRPDPHMRFLLPVIADRYDPPKPPAKLRIRGRRVRLRVPIG